MKRRKFFLLAALSCSATFHLFGTTRSVTSSADTNSSSPLSLRTAILLSQPGDTITFDPSVTSITLSNPLPAIIQNSLTITSDHPVTIDGNANQFQIFSLVTGTLTLENLILQNGLSKGGNGGGGNSNGGGGGGGAGGGGGLYVHTQSNVILNGTIIQNNKAQGGSGGNGGGGINSGGGGGGFGSLASTSAGTTSHYGNGGEGTSTTSSTGSGGGGGGHTAGGSGGSTASGLGGGAGLAGGASATTSSPSSPLNMIGGGGGGGAGYNSGGAAAQLTTSATTSTPTVNPGGNSSKTDYGGGGGGMGAPGNSPVVPPSPNPHAGNGGLGIGVDGYFGGGGGGGVGNKNGTGSGDGGAGYGSGGGGGAFTGAGGSGGVLGGGGGGSHIRQLNYAGGVGGFGAGGGGVASGYAAPSVFGGGSGGIGGGATGGGGGGGAAMGGNIFLQQGANLTIGDLTIGSVTTPSSLSGGTATGGTAGTSGGMAAQPGGSLGDDLFIASGATVTFTTSGILNITSNIESNQGYIYAQTGQTTFVPVLSGSGGGIVMNSSNGAGVLSLSGTNTYTASTTIQSGTVQVYQDVNLGSLGVTSPIVVPATTLSIGNGTLQTKGSFSSARLVSLTSSNSTIDTNLDGSLNHTTLTLTGIISGSGSLNKTGPGTLILSPQSPPSTPVANTYSGDTSIVEGELVITKDSDLGSKTNGTVTIASSSVSATLTVNMPGSPTSNSSARSFILQGISSFNIITSGVPPQTFILTGEIKGSGSLFKLGDQALLLLGSNSYSGGTSVQNGVLAGNTSSLQGDIEIQNTFPATALVFLQTSVGTYSGTLTGNGELQIGNNSVTPFPPVTFSNLSPGFFGPTTVFPSGSLNVTGSLENSSVTIETSGGLSGILSGTGDVGPVDNFGIVQPGSPLGTLTIHGDLTLEAPTSNVIINLSPAQAALIRVTGTANLASDLTIAPQITGFYGLGNSYTILTTDTNVITTTFGSVFSTNSNFVPIVLYFPNAVVLNLKVGQPFLNFPYDNPNEQSVGENIDALVAAGDLTANSPLGQVINSLIGYPDEAINHALDQMHPAPFSAFAEIQATLGGQLLSLFHRRPVPHCACADHGRFWLEPYGNWLQEKNLSYQVGFHAQSKGVAAGIDGELTDGWTFGIGGAWNDTHMWWNRGQGHSIITGYYGAIYTDYASDNFYLGLSCIGGFDHCDSTRHIRFATIDERAHAARHNLELMGQLTAAAFFGPSFCFAFPYVNIDYFYLKEKEAIESGAPGLNLRVREHSGSTLRSEAGFAIQVQDTNRNSTMCISPLFGLGWAMEMPINRTDYVSNFENQPISFRTKGWDYTWQLFTLRFGFTLTYECFSVYGGYVAEMSPLEHTPFFEQRGDLRFELNW